MCASERELGLGDSHDGIILLRKYGFTPEEYEKLQPGDDAMHLLHLDEPLLEINITPDRGYAFSYRGVSREYHHSTGAAYTDPAVALNEKAPITKGLPEGTKTDIEVIVDDNNPIHGVVGMRSLLRSRGQGLRSGQPYAELDASPPDPRRHAFHLLGSGCHQLRDARLGTADACLRSG